MVDVGTRLKEFQESSDLVVKSDYVGDITVDIALEPGPGKVCVVGSPKGAWDLFGKPAHVVLVAVKGFHTSSVLELLKVQEAKIPGEGLIDEKTLVVSCQNGIDNEPAIAKNFGWERTVGAVVIVAATLDSKGRVCCDRPAKLDLGLYGPEGVAASKLAPDRAHLRLLNLAQLFEAGKIQARIVKDIEERLWRKLVSNSAMNPLCALTGATVGELGASEHLRALTLTAMQETTAVGRACGMELPDKVVELSMKALDAPNMMDFAPSMLQDIRSGRRLELEGLVAAVTRRACDVDIPTPVLDTLEALLTGMTQT